MLNGWMKRRRHMSRRKIRQRATVEMEEVVWVWVWLC